MLLALFAFLAVGPAPGARADGRSALLGSPPAFGDSQFRRSCIEARGYGHARCDCALRAIGREFAGQDREIALLYLQLTLIAEHDVEAIMEWLDAGPAGACPPKAATQVSREISRLHLAPAYLYGALHLIGVEATRFKDWEQRDKVQAIRDRCLPPPSSVMDKAWRIEACIEGALQIKHCSRCHDYRGVDLAD